MDQPSNSPTKKIYTALVVTLIEADSFEEAENQLVAGTKSLMDSPFTLDEALVAEGDWRPILSQDNAGFIDESLGQAAVAYGYDEARRTLVAEVLDEIAGND